MIILCFVNIISIYLKLILLISIGQEGTLMDQKLVIDLITKIIDNFDDLDL